MYAPRLGNLCEQRRPRLACASPYSDQDLFVCFFYLQTRRILLHILVYKRSLSDCMTVLAKLDLYYWHTLQNHLFSWRGSHINKKKRNGNTIIIFHYSAVKVINQSTKSGTKTEVITLFVTIAILVLRYI